MRRSKTRRSRPRREKGAGGASLPARSRAQERPHEWKMSEIEALREAHAQRSYAAQRTDEALVAPIAPSPTHWLRRPGEYDVYGVDYPEGRARRQHEKRSKIARATDLAKKAPLASTPEEWAKHPGRYDLPGVDTPQKARPRGPKADERNPMGTPDQAKRYLSDVVEAYRRKMGVKGDVRLRTQMKGYPARIRHFGDGKASQIEVNYRHFGLAWERDPGLTRRYLEYMVAHELAHLKQREELGYAGLKKANQVAKVEVEADADNRAYKAMGTTDKEFVKVMDRLARRSGGVHVTSHPGFKGAPNLGRFEDHTPPEKPVKAGEPKKAEKPEPKPEEPTARKPTARELRERMKATYVKVLGGVIPTATDEEIAAVAERAIAEEWIDPDKDTREAAVRKITGKANAELARVRQEKAQRVREEQLKRLKERSGEIKRRDEDIENAVLDLVEQRGSLTRDQAGVAVADYLGVSEGRGPFRVKVSMVYDRMLREGKISPDGFKAPERPAPAPEPKASAKTRSESYDFYADPGHGWLRVPLKRLGELGIENDISPYSYVKGGYAYLEEDRDARIFTDALEGLGVKVNLRDHTANRDSAIRRYEPYRKPKDAVIYDEATEQTVKKILAAKKGITKADLEKMIDAKQVEAKGLLTVEAAVALIAQDLGVERPDALSPTEEEVRSRYDKVIRDRIPRMTETARLELRKLLLDQGYSHEDANEISGRLTAEAVHRNQSEEIMKRRMETTPSHLTPEIKAERDSLRAVQDEYEKLKREAQEARKAEEPGVASLMKATASSPVARGGMYEVEVFDPERQEKAVRRFSTPDRAEQYVKLINGNPGWPLEGFKESIGADREPRYVVAAENGVSRGSEALKYSVYERLPKDAKRHDAYFDGRPYKLTANGSIEYKEAPGKQKIVEDLIREYKGTARVEFTPNPHWAPALSMVERIAPASPSGDRGGKWMVWFKNREGRDVDPREGAGTRSFDTYGEALDFAREGRGRYDQRGVNREALWLTVPDPPTLPEELRREFIGKSDKFVVDPRPEYEGKWDSDGKQVEYKWAFKNQMGGKTYTLEDLKEEHQKGEWRRRDRAEAAKRSRTITREGFKRREWDRKSQPLASAVVFNDAARLEAEGEKVTLMGMNGNHTAMMVLRLPNDMGIPEGRYEAEHSSLDSRVTHLNHPDEVRWDNVERSLSVSKKDQKSYINYEKVTEYKQELPEPKVAFKARAKVDLEALEKAAAQKGVEHLTIKVAEGRSAYGSGVAWEATKHETRKLPPDEEYSYEREERVEVPVSGSLGMVEKAEEDEVKATYTASYIGDNLGQLLKAGFREATLEFATDMPLKVTARRDDGAEAEFWLAPCIGV